MISSSKKLTSSFVPWFFLMLQHIWRNSVAAVINSSWLEIYRSSVLMPKPRVFHSQHLLWIKCKQIITKVQEQLRTNKKIFYESGPQSALFLPVCLASLVNYYLCVFSLCVSLCVIWSAMPVPPSCVFSMPRRAWTAGGCSSLLVALIMDCFLFLAYFANLSSF